MSGRINKSQEKRRKDGESFFEKEEKKKPHFIYFIPGGAD